MIFVKSLSRTVKQKSGRPSKKTSDREILILEAIAKGIPYKTACNLSGIGFTTFNDWRDSDASFAQKVEAAEELSTNLAENAIRPVALGRKNWIHLGCEGAGPRIAAIISVIETCRRIQIRPRDYLGAILPGLADFPAKRVAELAPLAWLQTRH